MKQPLINHKVYNTFIKQRDIALERILHNTQLRITDVLNDVFKHALIYTGFTLGRIDISSGFSFDTKNRLNKLEREIDWIFDTAVIKISELVVRMRKKSYLLATKGEGEAIGRATGKQTNTGVTREELESVSSSASPSVGQFQNRIKLYMNQIRRDMIAAMEQGIVLGEERDEIIHRAYTKAIPARKPYVKPKRELRDPAKTFTEADRTKVARMDVGYVTPEDWTALVEDYMDEYIPKIRGPEDVVERVHTKAGDTREVYAWELERDVTQSFVEDVRNGQIDAARKNGIIDFIWIAIVDDKTDECCLWRDGLTTSDIEKALEGKHSDDECQAVTPPAHFNCRCTLAPAMEGLDELIPESNASEFEEWLNQRGE